MSNDEDDTFSDEMGIDDESEDYFPDTEEEEHAYEEEPSESVPQTPKRLEIFLADPWPPVVFVMMVIGFVLVLGTPYDVWRVWNWTLVGLYLFWITVAVATVIGIKIWKTPTESRMRYGGLGNALFVLLCAVVGTVDTILFIATGAGLIPTLDTPLLYATAVFVVFSLYSLWLVQKALASENQ